MAWILVGQAAKGERDRELIQTVEECAKETESQRKWLTTRLKVAAPQVLLAAGSGPEIRGQSEVTSSVPDAPDSVNGAPRRLG
jgi:hypothetical protein